MPTPSDPLRAAVPAPLDVLHALDADTFNRRAVTLTGSAYVARLEDAERAACVAAALPMSPTQPVHPAPFAAAVVAVAYTAVDRALSALWDVEHVAEALRLRMLDDRPAVRRDVDALESLWGVLDNARRRAELSAQVAREAMEATPEDLPAEALARLLDVATPVAPLVQP